MLPPAGRAECLALLPAHATAQGDLPDSGPTSAGFGPSDLQSAYKIAVAAATSGHGQTVALVDAYDDPDAASDLAHYRSYFKLPACPVASGCFRKVNQDGEASPLPVASGTTGWATEESLDIDMVSAICPHCHIILVEADNNDLANLGAGVNGRSAWVPGSSPAATAGASTPARPAMT